MSYVSHMKSCQALIVLFLFLVCCCAHANERNSSDLMAIGEQLIAVGCPADARVSEERVANRYEFEVTDTIKTLSCGGLEIQVYISKLASNPSGLPMHVKVVKSDSQLPIYMNIGVPVSELIAAVGPTVTQSGRSLIYYPDESEDTVTFTFEQGRITSVRWDWYFE